MYATDQIRKSFERIGLNYSPETRPTADLLFRIQPALAMTVPYENLDILHRVPLSLDYGDLYDKIVTRRRGGYCFEINGFYGELLRSLGYGVTEYMARYLRGEHEIPMRRHRVILAEDCEGGKWICDAGIGQSAFREPLEFREGAESKQYGEVYRVTKVPFFGWVISDLYHGEWRKFYSFTEEEQLNIDYVMPSFWCEHAPESPFRDAPMLSVKTPEGRVTVDGDVFRIFRGDEVEERVISEEERAGIYRKYFGLDVT